MHVDYDQLLQQLQGLAASFGPWGLLIASAIGVWLMYRKPRSPAAPPPAAPPPAPEEINVPQVPPLAPITNRPVINLALNVLARLAAKRFQHLPPDQALERYLVDECSYEFHCADRRRTEPRSNAEGSD